MVSYGRVNWNWTGVTDHLYTYQLVHSKQNNFWIKIEISWGLMCSTYITILQYISTAVNTTCAFQADGWEHTRVTVVLSQLLATFNLLKRVLEFREQLWPAYCKLLGLIFHFLSSYLSFFAFIFFYFFKGVSRWALCLPCPWIGCCISFS